MQIVAPILARPICSPLSEHTISFPSGDQSGHLPSPILRSLDPSRRSKRRARLVITLRMHYRDLSAAGKHRSQRPERAKGQKRAKNADHDAPPCNRGTSSAQARPRSSQARMSQVSSATSHRGTTAAVNQTWRMRVPSVRALVRSADHITADGNSLLSLRNILDVRCVLQ